MKAFRHIPFQSHPNSNGFSVCLFLLCALFTGCQSTSTVLSDKAEQPAITQKEAGEQVIEALNRAYGVDTIGLFLDSPRCPDFVEGMFYEDSLPVFQIRGDTAKARRILEASAGSGAFRLEADTEHTFTQKELRSILDTISNRFHRLPDGPLKSNMDFWGMGNHTALVSFKLNTPAARQAFRKHIIDSPAVSFEGPESPMPHSETGVSDTLGISLRPEYPVYSTQTSKASFVLINQSNRNVMCGEEYCITYEDEQGIWRELPTDNFFFSVGYLVQLGEYRIRTASLYPEVHPNKPGRYRLLYHLTILDTHTRIQMMTEFRLSNDEKEWKQTKKLKIPIHLTITQNSDNSATSETSADEETSGQ